MTICTITIQRGFEEIRAGENLVRDEHDQGSKYNAINSSSWVIISDYKGDTKKSLIKVMVRGHSKDWINEDCL